MDNYTAESMAHNLLSWGYNARLILIQEYSTRGSLYHVIAEGKDGVHYQLTSEYEMHQFLESQDAYMRLKGGLRKVRYLVCTRCGGAYSADPGRYRDQIGIFTCCDRAVKLYQADQADGATFLISEAVDLEYLRRPHSDEYTDHPPLQLAEEIARSSAPGIPRSLRSMLGTPEFDGAQIGFILHYAGYGRDSSGVWARGNGSDYHNFEEGDTIDFSPEETLPFSFVMTNAWTREKEFSLYIGKQKAA